MEYVEKAIPLRYYVQIFKNPSIPAFKRKRAFISFMASFIRTLHQKGIYLYGDLKSDNFLIKEREK